MTFIIPSLSSFALTFTKTKVSPTFVLKVLLDELKTGAVLSTFTCGFCVGVVFWSLEEPPPHQTSKVVTTRLVKISFFIIFPFFEFTNF